MPRAFIMQRLNLHKLIWLFFMAIWPVTFVAGQGRHIVTQGMVKEYRVTKQPDVISYEWKVFTDPNYTILATPDQVALISMGEGHENEIRVNWLSSGNYYLMVTAFGQAGCLNKKAWAFQVSSPVKLAAVAFCQDGHPWIKWDASVVGFSIETINIKILDSDGEVVKELSNAPLSGSVIWPQLADNSLKTMSPSLSSVNLMASFEGVPKNDSVTVKLDAPDCSDDLLHAYNDTVIVFHGITSSINILANDYGGSAGLDSSKIKIVIPTHDGSLTNDDNRGTLNYLPNNCFFGLDSAVYTVSDLSNVESNEAKIFIKVEINPNIDSDNDGILDINENIVGTANLCDTDTDMDGKPNFLDSDDDDDGILSVNEPGDLNENGIPDYLEDWKSKAVDDRATTSIDVPVWISVLENDSSTMVPATLHIITNPNKGYVNVDNNNSGVNYYPNYDVMGEDSFIYVVCDQQDICDTAIVVVTIEDIVNAPQVFTPNDDGYNDRYMITGLDRYPENSFVVFNRWGNVVYERNNYANDWDGKSNSKYKIGGKPLPVGVYYYILKYANNRIKQGGLYLER